MKYCPTNYYAYTLTNECRVDCPFWRYYADNTTWKCVLKCPSDPDYYSDWSTKSCVISCPPGTFAENYTRMCISSISCVTPMVADPINNRCVTRCTIDPMYFAMPDTKLCGPLCFNNLFADNTTGLCVPGCPAPYFGVNNIANFKCVQFCPPSQYKHTTSRLCKVSCPSGTFADPTTMSCVSVCPGIYYGRISDTTCVSDCSPLYRDDISKHCVSTCPTNYTANNNSMSCT